jgi:hypothetical protein
MELQSANQIAKNRLVWQQGGNINSGKIHILIFTCHLIASVYLGTLLFKLFARFNLSNSRQSNSINSIFVAME